MGGAIARVCSSTHPSPWAAMLAGFTVLSPLGQAFHDGSIQKYARHNMSEQRRPERILTQHGASISPNPLIRNAAVVVGRAARTLATQRGLRSDTLFFGGTDFQP